MRRIFFKKNKSLFTLTTINNNKTNKRIKKYFPTCLLFHFFLALTIITTQSNHVLFIKKVSRKIFQKYTKSFGGKI